MAVYFDWCFVLVAALVSVAVVVSVVSGGFGELVSDG